MIFDKFNRQHTYLRLSLIDNCNFRCNYCMPKEHPDFLPNDKLMTTAELIQLSEVFVRNGVTKIRLTGGEPLIRKDFAEILQQLSQFPVELAITTNGLLLDRYLDVILQAGIRHINVSLDSLQPQRFFNITHRNVFDTVWKNIHLLMENQLFPRLNAVLMKGENEDEINDFVALTFQYPIQVRFIEFMPFDGNGWDKNLVVSDREILETIGKQHSILKLEDKPSDTARKYQVEGAMGTFAIISTMSNPFCGGCNRIRITADGKLKNCLFSKDETDLLTAIREGQDIEPLIYAAFQRKEKERGGQMKVPYQSLNPAEMHNRSMLKIGG